MMSLVRAVLGAIILFLDRLFTPKAVERPTEIQRRIDAETTHLKLYQFAACPFCVKVRRHLKRRNLHVELRDTQTDERWERELVTGGGQLQVPCLRIENGDGTVKWLYESDDIISYLDARFSDGSTGARP